MNEEDVLFSHQGQIGFITLNRPNALHSLTLPMIIAIQQQLTLWKEDEGVKAIILQSAPGNAFCAGGDVRWLYQFGGKNEAEQMQFFRHEYKLNHFIHHLGKPYIALMDGVTMGGGVGLAMHGSHPVATERFIFAMPETSIGFFPDVGASHLLKKCPGALGIYLGLTGNRLNHQDSLEASLIKYVITSERIPEIIQTLRSKDLSNDTFNTVDECLASYSMMINAAEQSWIQPEINACFSLHTVEEIINALDKTNTLLAAETSSTLKQKCPLSLKVTLAQLHKAQGLTFDQCLQMDYDLAGHFMEGKDFYEGVRALLIDKDKAPQWQPESLTQVSDSMVVTYFESSEERLTF